MLRDCKYRLPCAWCDKYDKPCEAVEREIQKIAKEKECKHEWVTCGLTTIKNPTVTKSSLLNGRYRYCECKQCGEHKLEPLEECVHEWEITKFEITNCGLLYHFVCNKCGEIKTVPLIMNATD